MSRLIFSFALLSLSLAGCYGSDPKYTEYFPEANGDKPDIFEFSFVQVCESRREALDGAARFARRYHFLQERVAEPVGRIGPVYTSGAPMRAHLMVEQLHEQLYRVSLSTFRGFPTDLVLAAHTFNFCSTGGPPPNNSFKPKPLRGSA